MVENTSCNKCMINTDLKYIPIKYIFGKNEKNKRIMLSFDSLIQYQQHVDILNYDEFLI